MSSSGSSSSSSQAPSCSDGIDNDGDGLTDYPLDPGCGTARDSSEGGDEALRRASQVLSWSTVPADNTSITPMNVGTSTWPQDIPRLVRDVNRTPAGRRALLFWDLQEDDHGIPGLEHDPRDFSVDPVSGVSYATLWWDHGAENVANRLRAYLTEFKRQGGTLDFLVVDVESFYTGAWGLHQCGSEPFFTIPCEQVDARIRAIESDARYQQEILPAIRRLGFPSSGSLAYNLVHRSPWNSIGDSWLAWDAVMQSRTAAYYEQAIVNPARAVFPDLRISNYGWSRRASAFQILDASGNRYYLTWEGRVVGNRQAPSLYGYLGYLNLFRMDGLHYYEHTSFNALRYDLNSLRASQLSDAASLNPWIANKEFPELYRTSDFYQELVFHSLLTGAEQLLFWNPKGAGYSGNDASDRLLDRTVKEFDLVAGGADRAPILDNLIGWGDDFILTCMTSMGRKVCRFTPKPELGRPEDLLRISSAGVSIVTPGRRLDILGGTVWSPQHAMSAAGAWIVAPIHAP